MFFFMTNLSDVVHVLGNYLLGTGENYGPSYARLPNLLYTGGSRLSCTAVKPDSRLARIFVAKFLCIIKLIIIIG